MNLPQRPHRNHLLGICVLGLCAGCLLFSGLYIHAKAQLAQVLLERSWSHTLSGNGIKRVKPWPWADTYPVARMSVPRLGWHAIILNSTSGQALAFGPGHQSQSALPGAYGNSVIAGHRDTHFKMLASLKLGDPIAIEQADGTLVEYVVSDTAVVHERDIGVALALDDLALTLVTCYPFEARVPGGPLRFVVRAIAKTGELS